MLGDVVSALTTELETNAALVSFVETYCNMPKFNMSSANEKPTPPAAHISLSGIELSRPGSTSPFTLSVDFYLPCVVYSLDVILELLTILQYNILRKRYSGGLITNIVVNSPYDTGESQAVVVPTIFYMEF